MLVGLTGLKRSGKDTFAQALIDQGFELVRFADPLKEMLRTLYRCAGLDEETIERKIEGDLKEKSCPILCGKTPRHAMQTLGTEWRDMIGRDLWTLIWAGKVDQLEAEGRDVVTPDVRFHHETAPLKRREGLVVRIERPGQKNKDLHVSETEMMAIEPNEVVLNDGTIEDLHQKAKDLINDYRG